MSAQAMSEPAAAVTNAFASLAVRDLAPARRWYESLLGAASQPMPEVLEWAFSGGGGLQVYSAPERAGQCSCTLIVADVDRLASRLRDTGIAPDATAHRDRRVDTVMIRDPDGNSIAFAAPRDTALLH